MIEYRVIDMQEERIVALDLVVKASSPEAAAKLALGMDLVRSGAKRDLQARVYFQHPGQALSMVRLYRKATDRLGLKAG
ncbi:hypothetical protein SAMN05428969_1605 [Devosia sp. YR412]|uniref:hypothetical protein n=1 Tax=Devosia sp. YR412 TaxID=1881030 RepID=UPI0008CD8F65|nr:hypothetical protein [Devosia sp. YR412]SEQ02750.1 hypothetical protein SAMN05428969_1605 [Devosia sp. YR412]